MQKGIRSTFLAIALSVFLCSGVVAEEIISTPENWGKLDGKITGTIERVDKAGNEITVQSEQGKMIFFTDNKTIASNWTQKLPLSEVKKGMWTTVEYAKRGDRLVARWIDVANSKAQLENREKVNW
jgi:hypothetical protein